VSNSSVEPAFSLRKSYHKQHDYTECHVKKYVIAGVLIAAFVTPALAEEIYVVFDPASHKCEAMHNIPEGKKSMGKFGSMEEAKKAMASMKECG
jgi:hypothetical protein